jgi:hypothetical protein
MATASPKGNGPSIATRAAAAAYDRPKVVIPAKCGPRSVGSAPSGGSERYQPIPRLRRFPSTRSLP